MSNDMDILMNDENRAEEQVDAFLRLLCDRYGLTEATVHDLIQQLLRLQRRTERMERYGEWTAKTIITVLVGAFAAGVSWAIMHFVTSIADGTFLGKRS
jgi:hypothetical protein